MTALRKSSGSRSRRCSKSSRRYIAEHKMQIVGFSREVTLIDYGVTNDTEKFVTEICIPVTCE